MNAVQEENLKSNEVLFLYTGVKPHVHQAREHFFSSMSNLLKLVATIE